MFTQYPQYKLLFCFLGLICLDGFLIQLDFRTSISTLTFAMLNVGQGDGLFIKSPTGTEILIDAGPARSILPSLRRITSPFDRKIDALIITNPDEDHIGGMMDILKSYKVNAVFESGTLTDSVTYWNLREEMRKQNIPDYLIKKGARLDMGGGAVIDILFPDRDVSAWATNDGSVVSRLLYRDTSVMLTGDISSKVEKIILSENNPAVLRSTILKVGHHGSRTSTSRSFIETVLPLYALISDGKDNRYGHPHQETLDTLNSFGIKIFRTDLLGNIVMVSDGQQFSFSFVK